MGFTEEERTRNRQEIQQQTSAEIEDFLMRQDIDQGSFTERDLADAVTYERFTERDAAQVCMSLKAAGRVHRSAGRWVVGPEPPPMEIDQI